MIPSSMMDFQDHNKAMSGEHEGCYAYDGP